MPISEKIVLRIKNSKNDDDFKKLLLNILNEEDMGNHQFKRTYEKYVNDYLDVKKESEDSKDDTNN
ncbi:MAG: hypothetical protein K2I36_00165 [Ureaplasma sp.]|nr:hypothetical protein [Ureaplasma sp.]MDE7264001.1 hypothetical protein [Anaeroplasmataceae bacterium]